MGEKNFYVNPKPKQLKPLCPSCGNVEVISKPNIDAFFCPNCELNIDGITMFKFLKGMQSTKLTSSSSPIPPYALEYERYITKLERNICELKDEALKWREVANYHQAINDKYTKLHRLVKELQEIRLHEDIPEEDIEDLLEKIFIAVDETQNVNPTNYDIKEDNKQPSSPVSLQTADEIIKEHYLPAMKKEFEKFIYDGPSEHVHVAGKSQGKVHLTEEVLKDLEALQGKSPVLKGEPTEEPFKIFTDPINPTFTEEQIAHVKSLSYHDPDSVVVHKPKLTEINEA